MKTGREFDNPIVINNRTNPVAAIYPVFFSVVWYSALIFMTVQISRNNVGDSSIFYFISIFYAAGLIPLFAGLRAIRSETIAISPEKITYSKTRLIGRNIAWEEPTTSFRGILGTVVRVRRNKSTVICFVVDLKHPVAEKCIRLGLYHDESSQRNKLEEYAKYLQLPMIMVGLDGKEEVTRPEETDMTVHEKVRAGKIGSGAIRPYPSGGKMKLETGPGGFTLTHRSYIGFVIGCVLMTGFLIAMLTPAPFGLKLTLFLMGAFLLSSFGSYMKLEVNDAEISTHVWWAGMVFRKQSLKLGEIEEIRLGNDPRHGNVSRFNSAVLIVSDRGILYFGQQTSPPERDWLKDALLYYVNAWQEKNAGSQK